MTTVNNETPLRYVALFRGINIGKAKRVAMADLRALVEEQGYLDVRTLLNSGNVVFTTPRKTTTDIAARLKKALVEKTGVSAAVVVLSNQELAAVLAGNPFGPVAADPSRLLVAVLADPTDRVKVKALAKQDWGNELLAVGERVAYVWCADGILAGKLFTALDRLLGDHVTARNWATMTKIDAVVKQEK